MKYFGVTVLFGLFGILFSASTNQSFNGTFEWMNDGVSTGSCGIYYNTFMDKIAFISDKWFTSGNGPNDPTCKCNLKIDYKDKSITVAIRGSSTDGQSDNVQISYAAFYALNPSSADGYNAVFTFVDCN